MTAGRCPTCGRSGAVLMMLDGDERPCIDRWHMRQFEGLHQKADYVITEPECANLGCQHKQSDHDEAGDCTLCPCIGPDSHVDIQGEPLHQNDNYDASDIHPEGGQPLITSHDDQPDDPEAAADRSGNPAGAEQFPEPYTDRDLRAQIVQSLSGLESDYDVDGIITDYQARWQLTPFDALDSAGERLVPALEYWAMVANHTLIDDDGKPKHSADCDGWVPDAECTEDCPCNKPATVRQAADTAAVLLGLEVLTVIDARRGITRDGRRLVTIRLVEHDDPALQANGPGTRHPDKGVPGPF